MAELQHDLKKFREIWSLKIAAYSLTVIDDVSLYCGLRDCFHLCGACFSNISQHFH